MAIKRYEQDWDGIREDAKGELCLYEEVEDEIQRRIAVMNRLPEQQLALKQLLEWMS